MYMIFFFFFSSRRRHTRSLRDWSSDVCSSDLAGLTVVARQREAVPVLVVELHVIAAVVVARPTRFLAEQRVLGDGLRGEQPVVELPRALELVQVFGAHVAHVFLQHGEQ